jgi:glutamine synthetase
MSTRREVTAKIAKVLFDEQEITSKVSEYYGSNTFSDEVMKRRFSTSLFSAFKKWQNGEEQVSAQQASEIANVMKEWALEIGATSYTHWFQPMTGLTAEKHDSFISINGESQIIERFSGSNLIVSEPDASSFPSGGLRSTFEARGYTAWDPSSPAFIREVEMGKTLCIPSVFVSYNGEALDKKLPLLRSDMALERAAKNLLSYFREEPVELVNSTCGAEQEFFLIDEGYYRLRPDLQLAGRTLLGAPSPKGQQLADQYFGSIKDRVLNYMNDIQREGYKLGIPLTTRHNEVAPHQFEFAPIFERSSLAADHNQLLMDILQKVARKHGMVCLLHEKPFAGINGSGKHVNWSLTDDRGANLLNPGETPHENWQFLAILTSIIYGVHKHSDLLRASIVNAGNEHRLGANEAPPAIMSIFLGTQLTEIIEALIAGKKIDKKGANLLETGLAHLPDFIQDHTDRNRTSPFAFTGAKFEFRAGGSSINISTPVTVINTIVADAFDVLVEKIEDAGINNENIDSKISKVLKEMLTESKSILFEGNNYSDEWLEEAEKRGLTNVPATADSLKAFLSESTIELFDRQSVFSKTELEARYNIWLELYNKILEIEAYTLSEIVQTQVLPGAYEFQIDIGNSLDVLKEMDDDDSIPLPIHAVDDRKEMFAKLTEDIYLVRKHLHKLDDMLKIIEHKDDEDKADYLYNDLKPHIEQIRKHVDHLENTMPDDLWKLPKYREMLFNL